MAMEFVLALASEVRAPAQFDAKSRRAWPDFGSQRDVHYLLEGDAHGPIH